MDAEYSSLIDLAASIAESGRWNAVNKRIEHLSANPGKDNGWWVIVFASLSAQVFSEYLLLKSAYQQKKAEGPALLAWRARNLLELSVWCLYCAKSRENARRLYEDAGRDVVGLLAAFTKWGVATALDPKILDPLTGAKQDLYQRAATHGIGSLDSRYKDVRDAATECGLKEHFGLAYSTLSKFAHPTAMQIMASPDEARDARQSDYFFSQGCVFFTGAFAALEGQLT